jgi:hypothetical protein
MIDYSVMSPGLGRRLAYSLRFRTRREYQNHQRVEMSYEELANLQDVVVGVPIKDLVLNTKISFNECESFCCICQENIKIDNLIRTLRCNHAFHESCINLHSKTSNRCPMCRMDIILVLS